MFNIDGYWAILYSEPKSGTVGVRFRDHPNVITYGRDLDHASEMAEEALNAVLESEFDYRIPPPRPSGKPKTRKGEKALLVPVAPEIRAAWMLRSWREEAGLSQSRMARRLGITTQSYARMERPGRANLTLGTLDRVAHALGKRLVVGLH